MKDYERRIKDAEDLAANPKEYLEKGKYIVEEKTAEEARNKKKDKALKRRGKAKVDYIQKEVQNKALGDLGESFVFEHEKKVLRDTGRPDLAELVEQMSKDDDSLGYDIKSFDSASGSEIHIEVKTTKGKKDQPFFITANEVAQSVANSDKSYLYRLYNYNENSKCFDILKIKGDLTPLCTSPELYSVSLDK